MAEAASVRTLTLRRLHVLTGAVPLGAFLLQHVVVQASALGGQARYERVTGASRASAFALVAEVALVHLPLAFHALYGIALALRQKPSAKVDPLGSHRLAVLMRVSSIVTLLFVGLHLWEYRLKQAFGGLAASSTYTELTYRLSWTWAGIPWVALAYIAGIAATSFHFAYGLASARRSWGSPRSSSGRRRAIAMSWVLGGAVFLVGTVTTIAVATGSRLLPSGEENRPCGTEAPVPPRPSASTPPPPAASSH